MGSKRSEELTRMSKRKIASLEEILDYLKTLPSSKMKKASIGYIKSQIENINVSGHIVSMNMRKSQFLAFQEFLKSLPNE